MQTDPNSLFEWLSSHFHILGWGFVIGVAVKIIRFFTRLSDRAAAAENTLNTVASNHLAHIESSMSSVDANLQGMREDMRGLREDRKDFFLSTVKK